MIRAAQRFASFLPISTIPLKFRFHKNVHLPVALNPQLGSPRRTRATSAIHISWFLA